MNCVDRQWSHVLKKAKEKPDDVILKHDNYLLVGNGFQGILTPVLEWRRAQLSFKAY